MLGLNSLALNMFQTEKSQISRSLERLNMFKRDLRNMQEDIKQREDQSKEYLEQLPPLMNSMFEKLEELVKQAEARFKNKIFQIVRN
jgi:prefoldin subunit 5